MHSASVTFLLGYVEWKNVEKMNPLPSNGPWMVTDVSERMNAFPTHTLNHFQFNKLAKFRFTCSTISSTVISPSARISQTPVGTSS